jgi:two-component system response regulator VicR
MNNRIFYVEDDANLALVISDRLEEEGYTVLHFADGSSARDAFQAGIADVCVLDVMLPQIDGFTLGEWIRNCDANIPILFLTARDQASDRLTGLKIGDDYLAKPFVTEELLLRIENLIKRQSKGKSTTVNQAFDLGKYAYDAQNYQLTDSDGQTRRLTEREGQLLLNLLQTRGQVVRREDLLRAVWGKDDYFTGRSMDVFISRLRKYLAADPNIKIQVIHGIGFMLVDK